MAMFEGPLGEACEGSVVVPPCIYLVHGLDDDVFRHMASFGSFTDLLQPCRVVVLGYDESSRHCDTLVDVATLYIRDILTDIEECPHEDGAAPERVVLVGYGFGASIAYEMASQFEGVNREVALVLLDSAVTWLPRTSAPNRLGDCRWLGGPVEAALLICRAVGAADFARTLVESLAPAPVGGGSDASSEPRLLSMKDDVEDVLMKVYWELAKTTGMTWSYFAMLVEDNGEILDAVWAQASSYSPSVPPFAGPTLLAVASATSTSADFSGVEAENAKFCSKMDVVKVPGSHYDLCQRTDQGLRIDLPQAIAEFLMRNGFFGHQLQERILEALKAAPQGLASSGIFEIVD